MENTETNILNNLVKFNEKDYISISDENEICYVDEKDRKKQVSDFSMFNGCSAQRTLGKKIAKYALKDCEKYTELKCRSIVDFDGKLKTANYDDLSVGIAPKINMKILDKQEIKLYKNNFNLYNNVLSKFTKSKPIICLGEYPQKRVNGELNNLLEYYFNSNKKKLVATGKLYTINSQNFSLDIFKTKKCTEFIFQGKKYVRLKRAGYTSFALNGRTMCYSEPIWFEVRPVKFIVKNWKNLPKHINPNGDGSASYMQLESKDIIIAGIPYFDKKYNQQNDKINWENSYLNRYLNDKNGFLFELLDKNLKNSKFVFPAEENTVSPYAFDDCLKLQEIVFHSNIKKFHENFKHMTFKYLYKDNLQNIILTNNKPNSIQNVQDFINLENLQKRFKGFAHYDILNKYNSNSKEFLQDYSVLYNKLDKLDIFLPYEFVKQFEDSLKFSVLKECDFRFFNNEINSYKNEFDIHSNTYTHNFYNFAYYLGCFSRSKVLDKSGKETNVLLGQKASSFLSTILKENVLSIDIISAYFKKVKDIEKHTPNQDLLEFLSVKGKNGVYDNIELLKQMEEEKAGSFGKAIKNFGIAKQMRKQVDSNGKIKMLPWKEAITKANNFSKYKNVNDYNYKLADLFATHGIYEYLFDKASLLFDTFRQNEVPNNILSKPLVEMSYLERIEKIKSETKNIIEDTITNLNDLVSEFSYEFLDKSDPRNAIIGTYCDCCAIIGGPVYGSEIVEATVLSPDVQNLVVKDGNNNIIAKAALYVNREFGYVVLNDFELNGKYKKNQINNRGEYRDLSFTKAYKDRDKIFDAFMRGIKDFVKQYDLENPDKPIQKVNVGNGYNRLKLQCQRFKVETNNLKV